MIGRIALANMKYHKSKNILTGIAIFLTTMLLFVVPTIGYDMILGERAGINELYPTWHALFREVNEETAQKMAAHHLVKCHGLRSDVGYMKTEDADIAMIYMDEKGLELHQLELIEGTLPQAENEIVVTKGILSELSQNGEVGDTITVPYQVERNGWLDYVQEKEFVISGLLADTELGLKEKAFTAFVSEDFLKKEVPEEQVVYRFIFQVQTDTFTTTEEIEADIAFLAGQFGIKEQSVKVNKDSLWVNYIDPAYVPGIIVIMLIIVLAGVITIYSIYYVSMAVTGLFFMVIATIISCADPEETSRNNFRAQYEMVPKIKFGDKEHPELEWKQVMKENPMTEELKQKILRIQEKRNWRKE